jgi:DNA-binding MarR family transcriptional regulator
MSSQADQEFGGLSREQLIAVLENEGFAQTGCMALFHHVVADRLGLNSTDHKCLDLIKAGPVTPGQLARLLDLTTGAVTLVLDRLEREGFIRREHDPNDRRRIIVRADFEKIKADVAPLLGGLQAAFTRLCREYSDEELGFLIDYSRKVQGALRDAAESLQERPAESRSGASRGA